MEKILKELESLYPLFCCMFPMLRKKKARRPCVSSPVRPRRSNAMIRRGLDKHRRLVWIRTRATYTDHKRKILKSIYCDINYTLVAWCPQNVVSNDYISTVLNRYGDILFYLDNWTRRRNDELGICAGTIVQYSTQEEASLALRQLPMECRHIKILPLEHILNLLIDCELLYGEFGQHTSRVVISGKQSPCSEGVLDLHSDLTSFGEIERLFFKHRLTPGIVCEVTYSFLTQAYLATIMLEGSRYDSVRLSIMIDESPRDQEILQDAKRCLMFSTESIFPGN